MSDTVTFYSNKNPVYFTITCKSARESTLFQSMLSNVEAGQAGQAGQVGHSGQTGQTNKFQLNVTKVKPKSGVKFYINTTKMLKYVYDYFILWQDQIEASNYVKSKPIQTGDIRQVLQSKDIEYFEKYLLNEVKEHDMLAEYFSDVSIKRSIDLQLLNVLLHQVDDYLGIESLSNKIYAYIAVIIWNTSLLDYTLATEDPAYNAE